MFQMKIRCPIPVVGVGAANPPLAPFTPVKLSPDGRPMEIDTIIAQNEVYFNIKSYLFLNRFHTLFDNKIIDAFKTEGVNAI